MGVPQHEISALVDGHEIKEWSTYNFTESLELANTFSMTIPFQREIWDLCRTDRRIQILIDGVPKLQGYIDDRDMPEGEEIITISGRDRSGRLVQDCAPGINFSGLGILDIAKKLVEPWEFGVLLSNARNRSISLGHGRKVKGHRKASGGGFVGKARVYRGEDAALRLNSRVGTTIEPGQTRGQVLQTLAAQAGYLIFPSVDGDHIVIGAPDYDQDVQFVFFMPKAGSSRIAESTCKGLGVKDSTGDRYSRIIVVGSGSGTDANYGASVASRYAEVRDTGSERYDGPDDPEGVGNNFTDPKRLILSRSVQSIDDAQEIADREMARRDALGHIVTVRCDGHGQVYDGTEPTLFAPDTLAAVEDERTGTLGIYLITHCAFQSERAGEQTIMTLVRQGSELTQA